MNDLKMTNARDYMSEFDMRIVDVDYWEHDALLKIDNIEYYFQFDVEPTLESALKFFRKENKGDIVQLIERFLDNRDTIEL